MTLPDMGFGDANDLGKLFGMSPINVRLLHRKGVFRQHKASKYAGKYDIRLNIMLYVDHLRTARDLGDTGRGNLTDMRARLTKSKAEIAELQRRRMIGEVVGVPEMIAAVTAAATGVRQRFLGLAPKLAPRLVGLRKAADAEAIVRKEVHECLEGISDLSETPTRIAAQQDRARHQSLPVRVSPSTQADNI